MSALIQGGPLCRHCQQEPASRPRGLGWKCYYAPGVRELYPSTSKHARRSPIVDGFRGLALAASPTMALPRTPEKIAVLAERALAGVSLWHPQDARAMD